MRFRLLVSVVLLLSGGPLLFMQAQDVPETAAPAPGDFGRMFHRLAPFQPPDELLVALAASMQDPNLPENDNPRGVTSGNTYIGQFLDHDLTLDTTPLGEAQIDVGLMTNSRNARVDLDSMYGGGQIGSPQLYDGPRFRFDRPNGFDDFQRTGSGQAVLVEGRNDENRVIAQIHLAMQHLHNKFIDQGKSFSEAQRLTRWHWQWVVVNDFLPEIVGQEMVDSILSYNGAGKPKVRLRHYNPGTANRAVMPVEFSIAAYRFGHSMVRLAYVMPTGSVTKTQVFNAAGNDLRGGSPIPLLLKIDFANFFRTDPVAPGLNISRKIDALISRSLFVLPIGPVIPPDAPAVISLPERNLLRSKRVGIPSYQDVAMAMGITPLNNAEMGLTDPAWGGKAPLWFGLLKESELFEGGEQLGPTGGRIVAEVILGLIDRDRESYFSSPQAWTPDQGRGFRIPDLLRMAGAF